MNRRQQFKKNRAFSDQFIPAIKQIIGPLSFVVSDEQKDMRENADLVLLRSGRQDIACRIRARGAALKYPFDFTFRYKVPGGHKTEFTKMLYGFGDLFFYGFGEDERIDRWCMLDLATFRGMFSGALVRQDRKKEFPYSIGASLVPNDDGTSGIAFSTKRFRAAVIATSDGYWGTSPTLALVGSRD